MIHVAKDLKDALADELALVGERRRRFLKGRWFRDPKNLFGIALSGGGIRSAVLGLGFLEALHRQGILRKADYLSSVSGGGYIAGYVHSKLTCDPETLFSQADIERLRRGGNYLTPGEGLARRFAQLRLAGAYVASLVMNWVWLVAGLIFLLCLAYLLFAFVLGVISPLTVAFYPGAELPDVQENPVRVFVALAVLVLGYHYFFHPLRHVGLWSSEKLYTLEAILLGAGAMYAAYWAVWAWYDGDVGLGFLRPLVVSAGVLVVAGFFANPNLLTMHRFYRDRVTAVFLRPARSGRVPLRLHELFPGNSRPVQGDAPFPLINTCLNLLAQDDAGARGAKVSDSFILSPMHCGSEPTGYLKTTAPGYRTMTLDTAIAVSGASVNPSRGEKTHALAALLMTLVNARLGYWAPNPKLRPQEGIGGLRWWPIYHLQEMFRRSDLESSSVHLSDGGHIENLGVFELLRRRCRLIIALDASYDPEYRFGALRNLVVRARNELGLAIDFRQTPEEHILPWAGNGFSESHFVIADVRALRGFFAQPRDADFHGLLVYAKASLRMPERRPETPSPGYDYKTHHAAFPHESTTDQFFDGSQWEAYRHLGRFVAADLLNVDATEGVPEADWEIQALYETFDRLTDDESLRDYCARKPRTAGKRP